MPDVVATSWPRKKNQYKRFAVDLLDRKSTRIAFLEGTAAWQAVMRQPVAPVQAGLCPIPIGIDPGGIRAAGEETLKMHLIATLNFLLFADSCRLCFITCVYSKGDNHEIWL